MVSDFFTYLEYNDHVLSALFLRTWTACNLPLKRFQGEKIDIERDSALPDKLCYPTLDPSCPPFGMK
jgi:hypothetical protein